MSYSKPKMPKMPDIPDPIPPTKYQDSQAPVYANNAGNTGRAGTILTTGPSYTATAGPVSSAGQKKTLLGS